MCNYEDGAKCGNRNQPKAATQFTSSVVNHDIIEVVLFLLFIHSQLSPLCVSVRLGQS